MNSITTSTAMALAINSTATVWITAITAPDLISPVNVAAHHPDNAVYHPGRHPVVVLAEDPAETVAMEIS